MNTDQIRDYCLSHNWQHAIGHRGTVDDPDFVPVWGDTPQEMLASWYDITDAWCSGGTAHWLGPGKAVVLQRSNYLQTAIMLRPVMVGRKQSGSPVYENEMLLDCCKCKRDFTIRVPHRVPNLPERCPDCAPAMSAAEVAELASEARKTKAAPIKDAARDAVEHFREQGTTALLRDMLNHAVERLSYSGKGKDSRATNVKRELKKLKDIRIDGDIVILDG